MRFLDQADIHILSGRGGDGCISFRREKFIEFGGPDGGNGGRGGDVWGECVGDLATLIDFRYRPIYKAGNGGQGMGRQRAGAAGSDIVLALPAGTMIHEYAPENADFSITIADLTEVGSRILLASGGGGGRGNGSFKSSTRRTPRISTPGQAAIEKHLRLSLHCIADIGLIGLPNVGKSSLLRRLSAAVPKVGAYPFTTLHPHLGVLRKGVTEIIIADLPGLIPEAHKGVGLGIQFLGHAERCPILLHLIAADSADPVADWRAIRGELGAYGHDLDRKPELVFLNKSDLISAADADRCCADFTAATGIEAATISCISGQGLDQLTNTLLATHRHHNTTPAAATSSWYP